MKNLIRKLLGFSQPALTPSSDGPSILDESLIHKEGSDNAIRRQLLQMLLRNVLRLHGIPRGWIQCEMLVVTCKSRGPGVYVRLVIKHWDERLLQYAFAFQAALETDLLRFEPRAAEWLLGISWQIEPDNSCPYLTLPDPSFWIPTTARVADETPVAPAPLPYFANDLDVPFIGVPLWHMTPPAAVTSAVPVIEQDAKADLESMFFEFDQAIIASAHAVGYEQTQPAPLF